MGDRPETHAEIIAEMRKYKDLVINGKKYPDRLEAAIKRERGDVAKLREALERVLCWLKRMNAEPLNTLAVSELTPSYAVNRTAKSIIEDNDYHISQLNAALAAPPRNCDIYLTEEAVDAATVTVRDCEACSRIDMEAPCVFCMVRWLLAPAKEGGRDGGK